jgi:hypothetical protein
MPSISSRELIEVRHEWVCSQCRREFYNPGCILDGLTLNEIIVHLKKMREQAFADHVCLMRQMPYKVKVFRLNLLDWWAGYDLTSVKLAYLAETGVAKDEAFDEEEEVAPEDMKMLRIYPSAYAKESSTFQEELGRMIAENHVFPCSFAGRFSLS